MQRIINMAIVPAVRTRTAELSIKASLAISAGGIDVLEIPVTVPGALDAICHLTQNHSDLIVGAGTVLDAMTARMAILAGARFIVSPSLSVDVIASCRRYSVPVFAGAITPTEIITAWQAGADAVKVFPVSALGGPDYIESILAPLPNVLLMPMGGVNLQTVDAYLRAGSAFLGVGADLVDDVILASGDAEVLTRKAQAYVSAVTNSRNALKPKS